MQSFKLKIPLDACAQSRKFQQPAHESDLIEHDLQEERAECGETCMREIAPPIKVVAAALICFIKEPVIEVALTCEPTGKCPKTEAVDAVADHQRMGVETCDASVAVPEGMNPCQPMMGGGDGNKPPGLVEGVPTVKFLKAQEGSR